jgi:hypothetical protein
VNLLGRQGGGRGGAGVEFVPGRTIGQSAERDGFPRAGQVFFHEKFVEPAKGGDNFFFQRGFRRRAQSCAFSFGDFTGKFLKALQQRTFLRIRLHLVQNLLRHVAERDARRGDAGGEALLHQDDGLVNERRQGVEAGEEIFVILDGGVRSDCQQAGGVLLHAIHLGEREEFGRKAVAGEGEFQIFPEQVAAELIGGRKVRAVEGLNDFERA